MTIIQMARKGGKARAEKLSPERRVEIAILGRDAAKACGKKLGRPVLKKNLPL